MQNYLWTVSVGGTITAGGGVNDTSITVAWNSPGNQSVSVNYTNSQGCHAASATVFNVTVLPWSLITNAGNSSLCSGTTTSINPASNMTGATFSWTASGSSSNVTGFSPGNGSTIEDLLANSGFNIETVTYSVTPYANGCPGIPSDFVVTVVPVADAYFNPASQTQCSGQQTNILILSHVTGAIFTWTCNGSSGNVSGFSAGSGNLIHQTLINSGTGVETVTYHVTPVVNGCTGMPADVTDTVNPLPAVSLTSCWDPKTTNTAKPFRLKGGIPLGGTYSGSGISGGYYYPSLAGPGTHAIHYAYTNAMGCSNSANQNIIIISTPGFFCGNTLTDIRDNQTYPTVQFGTQCWMAANLNYGTMIQGNTAQRDNCTPEKYCSNNVAANCGSKTYYQWDELMKYEVAVPAQGLCPAGWHIPTETEWATLFSNFITSGYAGTPLKFTGFSGFDALLSGVRFLGNSWNYSGFATFFWSSTLSGINKVWAHGLNDPDPSVSYYPAYRTNAFSVRCVKD